MTEKDNNNDRHENIACVLQLDSGVTREIKDEYIINFSETLYQLKNTIDDDDDDDDDDDTDNNRDSKDVCTLTTTIHNTSETILDLVLVFHHQFYASGQYLYDPITMQLWNKACLLDSDNSEQGQAGKTDIKVHSMDNNQSKVQQWHDWKTNFLRQLTLDQVMSMIEVCDYMGFLYLKDLVCKEASKHLCEIESLQVLQSALCLPQGFINTQHPLWWLSKHISVDEK